MPSTTAISDDDYDKIASYIRQERPRSLTKAERLDILRLHADIRRDGQMQVSSTIGRLLGRSQKDVMTLLLEAKIIHCDVNCKPEAVNCFNLSNNSLCWFKRGRRRGHAVYAVSSAHAADRDVYVQHLMQVVPATPVVYLDESYIHHHYARHHDSLYDPTDDGPTKEMHNGRRFCFIAGIMAATPTDSFVVGVDVFQGCAKAKNDPKDCHAMFNHTYFIKWFEKVVSEVEALGKQGVTFVMDNAKYHKGLPADTPRGIWRKADLLIVCQRYAVDVDGHDLKKTIWARLKPVFSTRIDPVVVSMARARGHDVVFTPPHHSDLQTFEMVWAKVQGGVGVQYTVDTTFGDVRSRLDAAFVSLPSDTVAVNQEGEETKEEVPTSELAMDPVSGTSAMLTVVDETKEEHPSPNKANPERRQNREAKPENKKADYVAQAKAEHAHSRTSAFDSHERQPVSPSLVLKDIEYPPITAIDRNSLVAWMHKRDRAFLKRICKILGDPANKWAFNNAEMEEQCKKLLEDPLGAWQPYLKPPDMLKTFIKVVASCITSFNIRDRVGEQMKTVQARTLVEFSKILAEQFERTYQAELVMKSRGGDRKRGRNWDENGRRTGKPIVQRKNEQHQREAYYQNGNAPRLKDGYTKLAPVDRGCDGLPRAHGAIGVPSTNKYGTPTAVRPPLEDRDQSAPARMTAERYDLYSNNQDPVCVNQRKAELKAKRVVKAKAAEEDGEQQWIRLNGVFEVPYCPDTDRMAVALKEPRIGMACNNLPFEAHAYVDLALQLQTAMIFASDNTLKVIGIDIYWLLEQVAALQLDDDGDDVEEGDDALTEQPTCGESKDAVEAAFQDLINEVIDNQFQIESVQGLWRVLTKHDIWRLEFNGKHHLLEESCVYPDRVMQGHLDSALYVQSLNEDCYQTLSGALWSQAGPAKTKLYTHEVKWCGRIISGEAVKQEPEGIQH
ncbi:hypothetical protein H257_01621 [Aphanomyces astaci]|uniref:Tc1-like transposase DDE domain-containing protein n=1 Tax=Aphanomyces astaci TaxID=112090 RepID=W4HB63_APHAT|nr:hypothetical protein H257_01621 [Aphanomyces astaci]ETV88358.1 hypothetical protein H257_01621 [Aphanomyces astaci]|eukprot:XP_009823221.1 hypothetical protein H257_01621 [Aphanomyces astaci]